MKNSPKRPTLRPPQLPSLLIWLQSLAFLLGLGLLVYVINRVGVQPLFDALLRIGFGFFIVGLSGLRHAAHISMRAAVPAEHRRITFRQAVAARLGGEAISFLTFTGPCSAKRPRLRYSKTRAANLRRTGACRRQSSLQSVGRLFHSERRCDAGEVSVAAGSQHRAARNRSRCGVGNPDRGDCRQAPRDVVDVDHRPSGPASTQSKGHTQTAPSHLSPESKVYDFYKHHPAAFFVMVACNLLAHELRYRGLPRATDARLR